MTGPVISAAWDHSCDRCGCYWLVFWHEPTKDRRCYACRGYAAVGTPCELGHWRLRERTANR